MTSFELLTASLFLCTARPLVVVICSRRKNVSGSPSLPLPASLSARRTDADISLQHHQRRGGGGGGGRRGCARWIPGPLWISSSSPSAGLQPQHRLCTSLPAGCRAETLHFSGARSPSPLLLLPRNTASSCSGD